MISSVAASLSGTVLCETPSTLRIAPPETSMTAGVLRSRDPERDHDLALRLVLLATTWSLGPNWMAEVHGASATASDPADLTDALLALVSSLQTPPRRAGPLRAGARGLGGCAPRHHGPRRAWPRRTRSGWGAPASESDDAPRSFLNLIAEERTVVDNEGHEHQVATGFDPTSFEEVRIRR